MKALVDFYFTAARFAIACLLGCMVVLVFGNVVLRYAFNQGITVSEELSRIFFIWLTFLGAVVAMRDHAHLGVDSLVRRLSPTGARIALVAGHIMMFGATWLVLFGKLDADAYQYSDSGSGDEYVDGLVLRRRTSLCRPRTPDHCMERFRHRNRAD